MSTKGPEIGVPPCMKLLSANRIKKLVISVNLSKGFWGQFLTPEEQNALLFFNRLNPFILILPNPHQQGGRFKRHI